MSSFKLILGVLFGLLVMAIAALGIISFQKSQDSNNTSFWVRHTHEVLDQTEEIYSLYKEIQLAGNDFFIDKDPSLIVSYNHARSEIVKRVNDLMLLTSDNPNQQARIKSLESLLKNLMTYTDAIFLSSNETDYSEKIMLNRVEVNKLFSSRLLRIIGDIKNEEKRLLEIRQKAYEQSIIAFNGAFLKLLAGMAVLLTVTFFMIRYNFNKRILAQRELKKANELFVNLFNESPIGMVISELNDGVIIDCNKAYAELVNYSREEIIGKTAVMLKILNSKSQWNEIIKGAREKGTVRDVEVQLKPRNKAPVWVSISIQSILVQNKQCLLSAVLDMTVHKRAEEGIKAALAAEIELNKMKSNFVTLASHEFRTPLTTILSSTFLLENYLKSASEEKAAKHLNRIKSSVNNLTSILDEFLSLTRIEEGKVEPKPEKLNLKEYLENVCQGLRSFTKPGQNIIYQHTGSHQGYMDPVILRNIVNNLVSNAIKYSPPETDIYVSSEMNTKLRLTVKDSGIGIPPEDQKHLFERFYRASNAGAVQGTGLGLHIMKHYVDLLKGSIQVKSELGKGTELKIIFGQALPEEKTLA